jgi:hypothetical protein
MVSTVSWFWCWVLANIIMISCSVLFTCVMYKTCGKTIPLNSYIHMTPLASSVESWRSWPLETDNSCAKESIYTTPYSRLTMNDKTYVQRLNGVMLFLLYWIPFKWVKCGTALPEWMCLSAWFWIFVSLRIIYIAVSALWRTSYCSLL